jgi:DNA processing protein
MRAYQARQRASVYFALWEILGRKPGPLGTIWSDLKQQPNLQWPPRVGLGTDIVGPDADAVYTRVRASIDGLSRDVVVLEKGVSPYPHLLEKTSDAPEFIFVEGRLETLEAPCLAIVGTRNPSDEGRARAYKLGYLLAKRGVTVVSGLARGIDKAAHQGAIAVGGNTVAVLGTPIDTYYPAEHEALQKTIARAGLLVSQFYPGGGVRRYNFPMRNAVMSALCLGTTVVEASETSGALIQARQCLKQGRKLLIPRSAVENPHLTWPKTYLACGAICFSEIDEVLAALDVLLSPGGTEDDKPGKVEVKEICLQS